MHVKEGLIFIRCKASDFVFPPPFVKRRQRRMNWHIAQKAVDVHWLEVLNLLVQCLEDLENGTRCVSRAFPSLRSSCIVDITG